MRATVIGNMEARGICGSGLVDAVAVASRAEEFCLPAHRRSHKNLPVKEPVVLFQADIRELQLARRHRLRLRLLLQRLGTSAGNLQSIILLVRSATMSRLRAPSASA